MDWAVEKERFEGTESKNAAASSPTPHGGDDEDEERGGLNQSVDIFKPRESSVFSALKTQPLADKIEVSSVRRLL